MQKYITVFFRNILVGIFICINVEGNCQMLKSNTLGETTKVNGIYDIGYLSLIENLLNSSYLNSFQNSDKNFGSLIKFAHKDNNYKFEKASYSNIPNFEHLKIHLSKLRNQPKWTDIMLTSRNKFFINKLSNFDEKIFEENLGLKKNKIIYDERLNSYIFIYKYKEVISVSFIVKKDQYNIDKVEYPRNFQAVKIKII